MEKGYVENGFIVDLAHSKRLSEVIYGLSKILDMQEAKDKHICLKLGEIDLSVQELVSIKALVENMNSEIEFISTSSDITKDSAKELGIEISDIGTVVPALDINESEENKIAINHEIASALDKIFGDSDFDDSENSFENSETDNNPETLESSEASDFSKEVEVVGFNDYEDIREIQENVRETEKLPTLYIHRTLRSGQSISSEGNIVIIGDVNPGAEVIAKGDITVWGILAGIAHAGSDGNTYSRIRALKLNAIQIRIGNIYARRPDTVNTPYIHRTDSYVPEEARVTKNHILIYKLHEA